MASVEPSASSRPEGDPERAHALLEVGRLLAADLHPDAVLVAAARATARLLDVADVRLWLRDAGADVLRLGARMPAGGAAADLAIPLDDGLVARIVRSEWPFVTPRATGHPLWDAQAPRARRPATGVAAPFFDRQHPRGVLVARAAPGRAFAHEDLRLLQALSAQVAVALGNAGRYQDAWRRVRQLESILDVNRRLALGPELDEILARITEEAARLLGADGATLQMLEGDDLVRTAEFGSLPGMPGGGPRPLPASVGGWVAAENRPRLGVDAVPDPRARAFRRAQVRAFGVGPWLSVPLRGRERVLGVLSVSGRDELAFDRVAVGVLEAFADQAAIAIENARLLERAAAAEALRELARLKSEFLGTVSHELRTPLSAIQGYAELLVRRAPTLSGEQAARMAGEIGVSARTMARLVDDLLEFSQLEHGSLRLQRRRVAVADVLGHLVAAYRQQPGGGRIAAELRGRLEAWVDPERLAQVVGNLLANAVRYAPDGPIIVRATSRGGRLRVEVADRGPGIPPAERARVWERLYRGAAALQSSERGSGLGLAVVKHLVELHGGRVGLRSTVGRGTTVWFAVPTGEQAPG